MALAAQDVLKHLADGGLVIHDENGVGLVHRQAATASRGP
jgi:hypothetical protein